MCKKILVPLDGSTLAEEILPHAQALANSERAEMVILCVPVVPAREFFGRNDALASIVSRDVDKEAETYVKDKVRKLKWKVTEPVSGMIREGQVAETIIEVADEIHADVIAMSTHGRSGIARMLLGSVADKVVRLSHIPVMLIHPN